MRAVPDARFKRAEELRTIADGLSEDNARRSLQRMADSYDALAGHGEARNGADESARLLAEIRNGEARARAQIRHIDQQQTTGNDTTQAEETLRAMHMTLDEQRDRLRRLQERLKHDVGSQIA